MPLKDLSEAKRLSALCAELDEESSLAREGYRLAMRALLALIAIEVVRLAASRARSGSVTLSRADAQVEQLRRLIDEHFRKERLISFYAEKLAMTADRLNDHVKRATGVTAGHLIRQRVLTEAKRQLVFTNQPIHEIAYDLAFSDPSHFTRFFRKQTGTTPQAFREGGRLAGLRLLEIAAIPRLRRALLSHTELTASLVKRLTGKVKTWFLLKPAFDATTHESPPKEVPMRKLSSASVAMILAIPLYFMLFWGFEALRMLTSPTYGLDEVWRSQFVFAIGGYFHLTPVGLIKLAAFFATLKLAVAGICAVHILDRFRRLIGGTADSEILEAGLILVVAISILSVGPAVWSQNAELVRERRHAAGARRH